MARKISPETVLTVVKIIVALTHTWPLPKGASMFQVLRFKFVRFLCCVNVLILIVPMVYTIYDNDYDTLRVMKLWCLLGSFSQIVLHTIQLSMHYDRLQYLISEVEQTLKNAQAHENTIYQGYVDKCVIFYLSFILVLFTAAVTTSFLPILVDKTFPIEARYPFDVDYEPVRSLICLQHVIVVWQTFGAVCICCFMAFFMWFTAARFNILSQQFRAVNNIHEIIACLDQHNELVRFTREVIITFRLSLLIVLIIVSWSIIGSGLTIAGRASLADKAQFLSILLTGIMQMFSCVWPADYLMDASADIAHAVYESLWYNQHIDHQKNIPFILMKNQIPISVSTSAIFPSLSLEFYSSYLSTTFSYIMTLRIALLNDDEIEI